MNEVDKNRYSRQINLDGVGIDGQQKLLSSKVLIIGFGGLGTGVAMFLTRMGIGRLGIIDNDVVDISNVQRQILYSEDDVGKGKVKVGVKKLKEINKNIIIDEYDFLLNSLNAKSIIEKYDVIVDCTDNFYTRGIISRTCVENRKKCVFGAVSEFNGFIFTHVENSACFECIIGDYEKLCEQKSTVGVMGAMVGIISSMQALEVIKLILGIGSLAINKMIVVDGNDFSTSIIPISRNNNCYCKRNCL